MNRTEHNFPLDRDEVGSMLENHGILPTQQRIDIAHMMFERPQHLAAEQVLAGVNERYGHVSKATVYNTLGLFVRRGLVREVLIEPGRVFYDSNTRAHHHVYNVDSGELTDVPASSVAIQASPALPEGTRMEGMDLLIRVRNRD